jgi:hypothetical protein
MESTYDGLLRIFAIVPGAGKSLSLWPSLSSCRSACAAVRRGEAMILWKLVYVRAISANMR